MKLALFIGWAILSSEVFSQGTFTFVNYHPPRLDAPVYDVDCETRLSGPRYLTQAYVGLTADALGPSGPILQFETGNFAGYIAAAAVAVPGMTEPIRTVFFQMRAWEAAAGGTFEQAVAVGGKHGVSNISTVEARGGFGVPESTFGVESFCLVPEPSVLVLAGLGAAGLWMARRRREE